MFFIISIRSLQSLPWFYHSFTIIEQGLIQKIWKNNEPGASERRHENSINMAWSFPLVPLTMWWGKAGISHQNAREMMGNDHQLIGVSKVCHQFICWRWSGNCGNVKKIWVNGLLSWCVMAFRKKYKRRCFSHWMARLICNQFTVAIKSLWKITLFLWLPVGIIEVQPKQPIISPVWMNQSDGFSMVTAWSLPLGVSTVLPQVVY